MKDGIKVIKKDEQQQNERRIRPEVTRRLLMDEKRDLERRLRRIATELKKV